MKALRKNELMTEVMLEEFTGTSPMRIGRATRRDWLRLENNYVTWRRKDLTNLIAELEPEDGIDNTRVDQLKRRRSNIVILVADHAINVKQKVCYSFGTR